MAAVASDLSKHGPGVGVVSPDDCPFVSSHLGDWLPGIPLAAPVDRDHPADHLSVGPHRPFIGQLSNVTGAGAAEPGDCLRGDKRHVPARALMRSSGGPSVARASKGMPSAAATWTASPMVTSPWPVSIAEMVLGSILCPAAVIWPARCCWVRLACSRNRRSRRAKIMSECPLMADPLPLASIPGWLTGCLLAAAGEPSGEECLVRCLPKNGATQRTPRKMPALHPRQRKVRLTWLGTPAWVQSRHRLSRQQRSGGNDGC
jgi:hypothetical protein